MTMRLYQSRFFTPPQIASEEITEDKWNHSHSQPDRSYDQRRSQLAMVAALAGCVLTPIAYPGAGDVVAASNQTSMRYDRSIVYQDLAWTPYVEVVAEDVTVDKYARPFSEPTRRKVFILEGDYSPAPTQAQVNDGIVCQRPLSEPTRRKVFREGHIAFTPTQPGVYDSVNWHRPLSEPVRRITTRQQQELYSVPFVEDITLRRWYRPLSEPTRRVTERQKQDLIFAGYPPDSVIVGDPGDGAFIPGTETTAQVYSKTISFPDFAYSPYVETAEVVTIDKYGRPFSEPTRRKTFREGAAVIAPIQPQAGDVPAWHRPFSEPTRRKTTRQQQDLIFAGKPDDPVYWFPRLSEPTRIKVRQNQGSYTYPYQTLVDVVPPGTPGDGAFIPAVITTSVRHDRTIIFEEYTSSIYVAPATPGDGTEFNWWPNLAERLRQPRPVTQQQFLAQGPQLPITVTLEYAWHKPLSEPTRRKPFLEGQAVVAPTQPQANDGIGWHKPFDVPRAARRVVEFPSYIFSPYFDPPQTGPATELNWWPNLSERIRRHSLKADQQQAIIQGPQFPWIDIAWHRPLSEPTRRKPFREGQAVLHPVPQINIGWWRDLDVPTRRKVSAAFHPEPVQPHFVPAPSYGWYVPLSDPTRRIVFRSIHRPYFGVELDFTPSLVACSHTTLSFPTSIVTVTFGISETETTNPTAETSVTYPESETEVDWPTSTTNITECEE